MLYQLALIKQKRENALYSRLQHQCTQHRQPIELIVARSPKEQLCHDHRFCLAQEQLQQGDWYATLASIHLLQTDYPNDVRLHQLDGEATYKLALDEFWQGKIKERRRYIRGLRRVTFIITLLLCSGLLIGGWRFVQTVQKDQGSLAAHQTLLAEAESAMQQHEYRRAIDLYRQLLVLEPNHAEAVTALDRATTQSVLENEYVAGVQALENGFWSQAQTILRELDRKAPNYRNTRNLLAQIVVTPSPIPATLPTEQPIQQPTATLPANALLAHSNQIAFRRKQNDDTTIYIMQPDGSQQQQAPNVVLADLDALHRRQQWNRDRTKRVYAATTSKSTDTNLVIWQMAQPNKSSPPWLLTDFPGVEASGVWSPIGTTIAFVANHTGNEEIWTLTISDSSCGWLKNQTVESCRELSSSIEPTITMQQQTVNEWAWDKHPTWSPDGNQLAFYSNRSGRRQIWVMNADGTSQQNLSNSEYEDWDPVWIP